MLPNPAICIHRYQAIRSELMKSAQGQSALLTGLVDASLDLSAVTAIVQVRASLEGLCLLATSWTMYKHYSGKSVF
jgi:hypothetical protein